MTISLAEQIDLVEAHVAMEEECRAETEVLLALYPNVEPNNRAAIDRCNRELVIWRAVLETLRKLNTH